MASGVIILRSSFCSETCTLRNRQFLTATDRKHRTTTFHLCSLSRLTECFCSRGTGCTGFAHFLARPFGDTLLFSVDVGVQTAAFELLAFVSFGKLFADFLRNADFFGKPRIVRNRLHEAVLGW